MMDCKFMPEPFNNVPDIEEYLIETAGASLIEESKSSNNYISLRGYNCTDLLMADICYTDYIKILGEQGFKFKPNSGNAANSIVTYKKDGVAQIVIGRAITKNSLVLWVVVTNSITMKDLKENSREMTSVKNEINEKTAALALFVEMNK